MQHTKVMTRANGAHGKSSSAAEVKNRAVNLAVSDFCITHTHTHTH